MLNLSNLGSVERLCLQLRCSPLMLRSFCEINGGGHYTEIHIRRRHRSSRPRVVFNVQRPLRRVHKLILDALKPHVAALPEVVQGFRHGSSILKNAAYHVDKEWVTTADIQDFYDNIRLPGIVRVFERAGCERFAAVMLARICTLRESLPQGGRASPAISNLAAYDLDQKLLELVGAGITYTRYADDMTFSGDYPPARTDIEKVIRPLGFELSSFCSKRRGTGQLVNGLSVDNAEKRPRLPRWRRRAVEQAVHYIETVGIDQHLAAAGVRQSLLPRQRSRALLRLHGLLNAYAPIEPDLVNDWRSRLTRVTGPELVL